MSEESDSVQPEGQGGEASAGAPYQELLDRIPEQYRSEVEPIFKEWDSNTTKRFQESAEYKRGWEPYDKLGVNQHEPGEVEWALQMLDAAKNNPAGVQEWFNTYAQEHGLTAKEQQQMEEEFVDPTVAELRSQLGPLSSQLAEMVQWRETRERQEAEQTAQAQRRSELDDLKQKHPDEFDESLVERLLPQYIQSDPEHAVQRAFADSQAIVAQVQKQWVDSKSNQPPAAVSGGSANGSPDPPPKGKALEYAAAQALEQLRAARST